MDKEIIKNKIMSLEYGLAELAQLLSEGGQRTFRINTVVGSWTWNESTPQPEHKSIEELKSEVEKELKYFDTESLYIIDGKRSDYGNIENMLEKIVWNKLPHLNSRNLLERFYEKLREKLISNYGEWEDKYSASGEFSDGANDYVLNLGACDMDEIKDSVLDEFIESELGK